MIAQGGLHLSAGHERLHRPDHPNTLTSMNNLANVYATLGRLARDGKARILISAIESRFLGIKFREICISAFEEYGHNSTHLKDRLLLATPRLLAGWVKMPGERECYARFEKEWIYN